MSDEPILYSIEPGHLKNLRTVAKRLYTENRMNGDEMRDAAHVIMAVVRYAESMEALRGPGNPYVHVAPVRTPKFMPQHQAEGQLLRARGWLPLDEGERFWQRESGSPEFSHDAAVANALWDAGWRREDDKSRWHRPGEPVELFTTGHAVEVELQHIHMTPEHDS